MSKNVGTHKSYHNSGATNMDYNGNSGTSHVHERKNGEVAQIWKGNPDAKGTLYKDSDGVWRNEDGSVYRGGSESK